MPGDPRSVSSSAAPRFRVISGEGGSTTVPLGRIVRYVRLLVTFAAAIIALESYNVLVRSRASVTWATLVGSKPDVLMSVCLAAAMLFFWSSPSDRKTAGLVVLAGAGADAALLAARAAQGLSITTSLQGVGTGVGFAAILAMSIRASRQPPQERVDGLLRLTSAALIPVLALFAIVAGHGLPATGAVRVDAAMHRWDGFSGVLPSFAIARWFGMVPVLRIAAEVVCAGIPIVAAALVARQIHARTRTQIDLLTLLVAAAAVSIGIHLILRADGPMEAYAGAWPWVEPIGPPRGDLPTGTWHPVGGLVPLTASWMILCFFEARTRSRREQVAAHLLLAAGALAALGLGHPWIASLVAPFPVAVALRAWIAPSTHATARPKMVAGVVGSLSATAWIAIAVLLEEVARLPGWIAWTLAIAAIVASAWADARLARVVTTGAERTGTRSRGHLRIVKAS